MKDWRKIVEEYKRNGYEVWEETDEVVVMGIMTYVDCYGECGDWEEIHIDKRTGEVSVRYGTSRSVPGWEMDEETGEWRKIV